MNSRPEKAVDIYSSNCNCAQAALAAFEDITGLSQDTALRLASPLGGGIGGMRLTCGALTGASIAAGMARGYGYAPSPEEKKAVNSLVQEFARNFKERFGAIDCASLLEKNERDGLTERPCARYVAGAVEILEKML
ncbi:MAG: C-GCAxxG-C-C family protein [Oscillospiraceae bacterium]|jgi:C_GCAxxG_C_C family probable redox protein|nr:C-GCAxxG-C-C family protein [Oscillospiraceae bacterium]